MRRCRRRVRVARDARRVDAIRGAATRFFLLRCHLASDGVCAGYETTAVTGTVPTITGGFQHVEWIERGTGCVPGSEHERTTAGTVSAMGGRPGPETVRGEPAAGAETAMTTVGPTRDEPSRPTPSTTGQSDPGDVGHVQPDRAADGGHC